MTSGKSSQIQKMREAAIKLSARESNHLPNLDSKPKIRAKNPSKKSKKIPKNTKNAVSGIRPFTAKITAILPHNKFKRVIRLGMCFFKRLYLSLSKNSKLFSSKAISQKK